MTCRRCKDRGWINPGKPSWEEHTKDEHWHPCPYCLRGEIAQAAKETEAWPEWMQDGRLWATRE